MLNQLPSLVDALDMSFVEEAQKEILNIIKKRGGKTVIKSKSMTTEEIHLNEFLEKNDIEILEKGLSIGIVLTME